MSEFQRLTNIFTFWALVLQILSIDARSTLLADQTVPTPFPFPDYDYLDQMTTTTTVVPVTFTTTTRFPMVTNYGVIYPSAMKSSSEFWSEYSKKLAKSYTQFTTTSMTNSRAGIRSIVHTRVLTTTVLPTVKIESVKASPGANKSTKPTELQKPLKSSPLQTFVSPTPLTSTRNLGDLRTLGYKLQLLPNATQKSIPQKLNRIQGIVCQFVGRFLRRVGYGICTAPALFMAHQQSTVVSPTTVDPGNEWYFYPTPN